MAMNTRHISRLALAAGVVALGAGACILKDQEPPPFVGPSELSTSLTITAAPDMLPEDGISQSVVTVFARDEGGQPIRSLQLRIDTFVFDVSAPENMRIVDIGKLSARTVATGTDGRASVTFTAPASLVEGADSGTEVLISVTPIGTNFSSHAPRYVKIRLVPPSVITVPGAPIPNFTYSPINPGVLTLVLFDASASIDPDGTIVSYEWDWGDGEKASGKFQDHDWTAAGTYFVKLTVTDDAGLKSFLIKPIVISG
jgi:chitodextrinase